MKLFNHIELSETEYYARYETALTESLFLVLPGVKQTFSRDKEYEWKRSKMLSPVPEEAARHSRVWQNPHNGMSIIVTVTPYAVLSEVPENHPLGCHASIAHPRRLPTWEEFSAMKQAVFGEHIDAMQVHPRKELYYNLHNFCLHWWELPVVWTVNTP